MDNLGKYLQDLERRINPYEEEKLEQSWREFADLKCSDPCFAPVRKKSPAGIDWPAVNLNDAIEDAETMIYSQLKMCSDMLQEGTGELLSVRMNYGTGIIPSMFGAEVFMMPYENNTLPGSRSLPNGKQDILRILDSGKMDFGRGLAGKVFSVFEQYREKTKNYPNISRYVHCYNPDLQGPFSLCASLWGSDIYFDFYDDTDTIESVMDFLTEVYICFTEKWQKEAPPFEKGYSLEWGMLHRGGTIIRNDEAMNISGSMYETFVAPRDQKILDKFGGGIHFCGKGDHYIEHVSRLNNLSVINMSQPEYNDMETIYRNTVDKNILIIGMQSDEVRRALSSGRKLDGRVHSGASLAAWLEKGKR